MSKEIATVDSNKSYASLFGSKPAQTEHENHDQDRGLENQQHQSNQSQFNQNQDARNFDQDRSDRSYDQNHMNQNQNQNQSQNDRNFPSFNNQRNENQRDRDDRADGHWDNKNGGDDHPQNAVARKKQLFDPRSNKMVDPELHPENLPPSENQKQRSQQLQGQGQGQGKGGEKGDKEKGDKGGDAPHESLKRPRPQQSRHEENTWARGMTNPKTKEENKNIMIPPSDLAADGNDNAHEVIKSLLYL